ncbi:MAG: DHA2 family efflux MFS transporter permease subunit [Alphaproteobacteria bacterium]|nr:DHA2 family efflux MFS transporter permease subunit [Alphaproteobacteria bacterium]
MVAGVVETGSGSALRRAALLATLTLGTMSYVMSVMVANVSLPQMQGSLSATQDQIALVVTFNLVATAIATPMGGWLVARFGRRRVVLFGLGGFIATSFLCGTATTLVELIIYRVIQGAIGAPIVPVAQAISLDAYPRHQHGMVTAVYGLGVTSGPIIGSTLGGLLSDLYGWRYVFYLLLPFGALAFLGAWLFVADKGKPPGTRLDWTGFLALSLCVGSLQLMLDRGERLGWFEATGIVLAACTSLLGGYLFLVHAITAERPFLNLRLLSDRNYALGMAIALLFGMVNFTPMVLLPTLLQGLRGYPDDVVGYLLAARGGGTFIGFLINIVIRNMDPRMTLFFGFALQGVAGWEMATFDINLTTFDVAWTSGLQGLGVGLVWVPLTVLTFATLEPRYLPEGTAVFHLLRNVGSSVHISLSVALVLWGAKENYAEFVRFVTPLNELTAFGWSMGGWRLDSLTSMASLGNELQRQAAMIGYVNAFFFYAGTAFVAVPLIFMMRFRRS